MTYTTKRDIKVGDTVSWYSAAGHETGRVVDLTPPSSFRKGDVRTSRKSEVRVLNTRTNYTHDVAWDRLAFLQRAK